MPFARFTSSRSSSHVVCQPGAAAELVDAAEQLISALPTDSNDLRGMPAELHLSEMPNLHAAAARLLANVGMHAHGSEGLTQQASSLADQPPASAADQQAAAWSLLRALPRMAAVVRALSSAGQPAERQLTDICGAYSAALDLLDVQLELTSEDQLAAYAAAVNAWLPLLPALHSLDARWRQQQPGQRPTEVLQLDAWQRVAAQALTNSIVAMLWVRPCHATWDWSYRHYVEQQPAVVAHA